ncbi:unnamed protein product [Prunus armeniaca]
MERQLTVAYSPQQNGVVERKNRTIVEMSKAMMHEKRLPFKLWGETVNTVVYIQNRCPTRALDNCLDVVTKFQPSQVVTKFQPTRVVQSQSTRVVQFQPTRVVQFQPSQSGTQIPKV